MPGAGFEPARPEGQRLLRPPRLPFRHPGSSLMKDTLHSLEVFNMSRFMNQL